jgi:endoglucanase
MNSLHLLSLLSCLSLAVACTVDKDDPGPDGSAGSTGTTGSGGTTGGSGATCATSPARATAGAAGAAGNVGTAGTGGGGVAGGPATSPYIVVDQFGYLPDGEKVAVIRDPETGLDASASFTPGATYALVEAGTGTPVLMAAPVAWNGGATDISSGDKAWWFTFNSVTTPGDYYVLDVDLNVRSYAFRIADDVYADVLRQAVRMFFYQRAGQAKDAAYAGAGWADCASHVGPLQDHNCRIYNDKNNAATERDVWGGWYDAGDLNKYTSWTAGYAESLLRSYAENPTIWTDDYGIPESGNGIPDVLDEALWGLDYLTRLQGSDGSMLSIVGEAGASPPSSAARQSLYGPPTTAATHAGAAAFAVASRVLRLPGNATLTAAADDYLARAKQAWTWAEANPSVQFKNNDSASGSSGLGAGQQEPNNYGRLAYKFDAAAQLFAATGDATYQTFFDANYTKLHLFAFSNYVSPWDVLGQDAALDYADAAGATASVAQAIRDAYLVGAKSSGNLGAITNNEDPYLAYMKDYVWGSNSTKSNTGNLFAAVVTHQLDAASNADMIRAASRYVHYLHGTNPLSLVYLTNMYQHGAENCANELYHSWFVHGSALWDRVGMSTYGPPPGFLTGGPNPSYNWDACCPSNCSSAANNAMCGSAALSPPREQPPQKAYKDFNNGWPLNSWSVTEPSNGYQIAYIRLLSKFVR